MLSGLSFPFDLDFLFEFSGDTLNMIMPVLLVVLGVLLFGLVMDQLVNIIERVIMIVVRTRRSVVQSGEDDDSSDG